MNPSLIIWEAVQAFFCKLFEAILQKKNRILIITYITIGVSSGRESKEGEIVLQLSLALAIKTAKHVLISTNDVAQKDSRQQP